MKHLALIGVIAVTGCSVDNSDSVEQSYTYTQTDAGTGLTLNPSSGMWVSFEDVVNIYKNTEACMGMIADGPTVEYKDLELFGLGNPWGVYVPAGELVLMNNKQIGPSFPRDKRTDTEALRHEFVHHILYMNDPTNWRHGNPMFARCGLGVNTYN